MAMMKKPKKPAFDASSLPKSKGITARPAKKRDTSPNFVDERKGNDPGTNPGGSPIIKYMSNGPRVPGVEMQIMKSSGKFKYDKQGMSCGLPSCDKPIKNNDLSGGKKGTKPSQKKASASPAKKASVAKKPMMKGTKK